MYCNLKNHSFKANSESVNYPGGIVRWDSVVFFGIETYIGSSSFRSKKFSFQVFLIITVDTNLEDLFTDSISVFTTVSS